MTSLHIDVLGFVLLTNALGAVVAEYEYDPFGNIIGSQSNGVGTNYLFTNQEFDPESELYYYNARYYNPSVGRFISRDAVVGWNGDTLSRNRYIYVSNNPLKYIDPTGEIEEELRKEREEEDASVQITASGDQGLTTGDKAILGVTGGYIAAGKLIPTIFRQAVGKALGVVGFGYELFRTAGVVNASEEEMLARCGDGCFAQDAGVGVGVGVMAGAMSQIGDGVTVYRVEGKPNTKVLIDNKGNVNVIAKSDTLFINAGDEVNSVKYLKQKIDRGLPDPKAKSFQVPQSFIDELNQNAVDETFARKYPDRPFRVHHPNTINQFGLRRPQIEQLKKVIVPGSGKDVTKRFLQLVSKLF